MNVSETSVQKAGRPNKLIAWANLCRVVAIYGVILIHSCGAAFYQYDEMPLGDWLSVNFLDSSVRCAIPLFVMLSGALLLKPGAKIFTFSDLARRVRKVLVPLVVWSLIYLQYNSHNTGVPVDGLSVLAQPAMYHLWFAYMIIGLYIFLPVFQALFEMIRYRMDLQIYFFVLWFVVTCLPVYCPLPMLPLLKQTSFFGYGGYFLVGAVIASSRKERVPSLVWLLVYLAGVFVTFSLTWWFSKEANAPVERAYVYFSPNVLVSSIAAFILFTRAKVSSTTAKRIQWIADKSFLVFFIHVLPLEYVRLSKIMLMVSSQIPMVLYIFLISAAVFAVSLVLASVLRFVPRSQHVLG